MSAATSFGYSYQRFRWPLHSLPFSSFSSHARCLGLRVLIFGVAAVSSAMDSFLQAVVTEKGFQRASGVSQLCADSAGKFKAQERVRGPLQFAAITIPPRLLPPGPAVHVDILRLHHLEQPRPAMRAAPAARPASAVGRAAGAARKAGRDRKSTRLNSSHGYISYAVFCLQKK